MIPTVVGAVLKASLQDDSIGKILRGIGVIISGLGLISASLTSHHSLDAKISKLESRRVKKINKKKNERCPTTLMRLSAAGVGLSFTLYGIYEVFQGFSELKKPQEEIPFPTVVESDIRSGTCLMELEYAKETLMICPDSRALWERVWSEGNFTVSCATFTDPQLTGIIDVKSREISIADTNLNPQKSLEKSQTLLLKLTDLDHAPILLEVHNLSSYLPPKIYAAAIERTQYCSAKLSFQITKNCVETGFWPENIGQNDKKFSENGSWSTYKNFLESQIRTGHFNIYIKMWHHLPEREEPEVLLKAMSATEQLELTKRVKALPDKLMELCED